MTAGHKHRHLRVKSFDGWWVRMLRMPLRHTTNTARVDPSPYPYGPCEVHNTGLTILAPKCWVLTPLGILHRWTGLTLKTPDE